MMMRRSANGASEAGNPRRWRTLQLGLGVDALGGPGAIAGVATRPTPAGPHHQRRNLDETLRLGRLAVRQLRLHVHMQLDFSGVVGIRERPRGSQPFGDTQLVQARHRGQKRRGAVPVQPGAARTAEIRQASRLASSRVRLRWGGSAGLRSDAWFLSVSRRGPTAMIFRGTE